MTLTMKSISTREPRKKKARKNRDVARVGNDSTGMLVLRQKSIARRTAVEKEFTRTHQAQKRNKNLTSSPKTSVSRDTSPSRRISPRKRKAWNSNDSTGDKGSQSNAPILRNRSSLDSTSSSIHNKSSGKNSISEKMKGGRKINRKSQTNKFKRTGIDNEDSSSGMQSRSEIQMKIPRRKKVSVDNHVGEMKESATVNQVVPAKKYLLGSLVAKLTRNNAKEINDIARDKESAPKTLDLSEQISAETTSIPSQKTNPKNNTTIQKVSKKDNHATLLLQKLISKRKLPAAKSPPSSDVDKPMDLKTNHTEQEEINEKAKEIMSPPNVNNKEDVSTPMESESTQDLQVIDLVSSSEDENDESEDSVHKESIVKESNGAQNLNIIQPQNRREQEAKPLGKRKENKEVEIDEVSRQLKSQSSSQEEHFEIDHEASICWSCGISLGSNHDGKEFSHFVHLHPLLQVPSCSVCADKAYIVEDNVQEIIEKNDNRKVSELGKNEQEGNICSWCADEYQQGNNILLCDSCPRGFCDECVTLAHGSGPKGEEILNNLMNSNDMWSCLHCKPTTLMNSIKNFWDANAEDQVRNTQIDENPPIERENDDDSILQLLGKLSSLEDQLESVSMLLEEKGIDDHRKKLEREYANKSSSDTDQLQDELDMWVREMEDQHARCSDDIGLLQDDIDSRGIDLGAFYATRQKNDEAENEDRECDWKRAADQELDERDVKNGFLKGFSKGATGWDGIGENYELDLEDLGEEELDRIEEIASTADNLKQLEGIYQKKYGHKKAVKWVHKYKTKILPKDNKELKKLRTKAGLKDKVRFRDESEDNKLDESIVQKECKSLKRRDGSKVNVIGRGAKRLDYKVKTKKSILKSRNRLQTRGPRTLADHQVDQDYGNDESVFEDSDCILTNHLPDVPRNLNIAVAAPLAKLLKPHQVEGVKFMWKNSFSDLQALISEVSPQKDSHVTAPGGCILAHDMGLGKSLQVVALLHTLLTHPRLKTKSSTRIISRMLLTVPVNTLENWKSEFSKWIVNLPRIKLFDFSSTGKGGREQLANRWEEEGGIMIITYDTLARTIKNAKNNNFLRLFQSPGPDVVILDEGHLMLKNNKSEISKSLSTISTPRRIVLTGTPLQNNLLEFYRMVNWIQPGCLDSEFVFEKKFASRIMESLTSDASLETQKKGESLLGELFETLSPFIHRLDSSVLKKELPHIQQAVLHVRQTKVQMKLYRAFKKFQRNSSSNNFLEQYSKLFPVNNHPGSLLFRESVLSNRQNIMKDKSLKVSKTGAESHVSSKLNKAADNESRSDNVVVKSINSPNDETPDANDVPVSNFLQQYNKLFKKDKNKKSVNVSKAQTEIHASSNVTSAAYNVDEGKNVMIKLEKSFDDSTSDKNGTKRKNSKSTGCVEVVVIDDSSDDDIINTVTTQLPDDNIADKKSADNENEVWWKGVHQKLPNLDAIQHGGKAMLLLQILAHSEMIGDKVVVFSQCLKTLDFLESILRIPDWGSHLPSVANLSSGERKFGGWVPGRDYLRIDGQTSAFERGILINQFNESPLKKIKKKKLNVVDQEVDESVKAFFLSSRAGSVGINLVAANRVVIFDSSWNPVVDQQALYRCYRYGQTKEVYAYRFLTENTMEEKVYSRSVNKSSLAARVIDQKDPKRNFTQRELSDIMAIDVWVQCDKCQKWRMMPPSLSQADADALPDEWYCYMNVYDPARSSCRAKERDSKFMTQFYMNEAMNMNDPTFIPKTLSTQNIQASTEPLQSQASNASSDSRNIAVESIRDSLDSRIQDDDDHLANTERDEILTGLLQVKAPKSSKEGDTGNHSKNSKRLVTKYYFHDSLMKETNSIASAGDTEN